MINIQLNNNKTQQIQHNKFKIKKLKTKKLK